MIASAARMFAGAVAAVLLSAPAFAGGYPYATSQPDPAVAAASRHIAATRTIATAHTVAFVDDRLGATLPSASEDGWQQSDWRQTGIASWYGGSRWQGQRTSSGSAFDDNQLTAAHATLPLGSKVLVSLHNSRRTVVVTITDRPGIRSRIIDLSRSAAGALGILDQGLAMVTLSPM